MKTIMQALVDEIHYPIPVGFVENKLIERQLDGDEVFTFEIAQSKEWKGALADCLFLSYRLSACRSQTKALEHYLIKTRNCC